MKYIEKQTEPNSFQRYKRRSNASYQDLSDNYREVKQELRESLVSEQGYICCYCGCRITTDTAIIEHLKPRQRYSQLQLEYNNLLASCDGGQSARHNGRKYPSCCDDHKENKEIAVNPLMIDCESRFKFDEDGQIFCAPDDIDAEESISTLNLKSPVLKNRRNAAIDGYKYLPPDWDWEEELLNIMQATEGVYQEFCFVIKSYIENYKIV